MLANVNLHLVNNSMKNMSCTLEMIVHATIGFQTTFCVAGCFQISERTDAHIYSNEY